MLYWFYDLKVGTKILLLFITMLIFIIVATVNGLWFNNIFNQGITRESDLVKENARVTADLKQGLEQIKQDESNVSELSSELQNKLEVMETNNNTIINQITKESHNIYTLSRNIAIIILLLALISGMLLYNLIKNAITAPLVDIVKQMKKAGDGDLTARTNIEGIEDESDASDEVAKISVSFNNMLEEFSEIINRFRDLTNQLTGMGQELASSTTQLNRSAEEVGEAIQELASGAEEQSGQVETARDHFERLDGEIDDTRDSADEMSEQADKVIDRVNQGAQYIDESLIIFPGLLVIPGKCRIIVGK